MNVQQQESNIASMLLECISNLKDNGIRNKHVRMFESNFKMLYNDVRGLSPLNESFEPSVGDYSIVMNNPANVAAYLRKVLEKLKVSHDVVTNLNENFSVGDNQQDEHDIEAFGKYARKLLRLFARQNDLLTLPQEVLKIKKTLHLPIRVSGMDVTNLPECDTALYDGTYKSIILVKIGQGILIYDLDTDNFVEPSERLTDTSFISKMSVSNAEKFFKFYLHPNIVTIYQNPKSLQLKYTDNLYKDQAQKSYIADLQKKKQLSESYSQLQAIFG